ncbi:hypothetical protein A5800_001988 [Enterococcus sp. 5B7_DIV0075]|uniref:isochorismate synthase n=1 Tax=Enterococcus sp. 5B7_DIV0075 TaxID=1987386 RepID=UPI000B627D46|nr:isochorismate synthase [Enterococcus sp. 5B7_DIV0075]OTP24128.1 hypothetical protein A5800_001988 [Enterococcus sp. 5B7_DIV0075]
MKINLSNWKEKVSSTEKAYFSYSYELPSQEFGQLFAKTSDYRGARFFWQTPDRHLSYIGLGTVKQFFNAETEFEAIERFKKEFFKSFCMVSKRKEAPILFGGFPFDREGAKESFWGKLENGYFVLPEILFTQREDFCVVTLTCHQEKETCDSEFFKRLEKHFESLENEVANLLDHPPVESSCTNVVRKERNVGAFVSLVDESVEEIKKTNAKLRKVVLARQMELKGKSFSIETIVENLLRQQPNTYVFALEDKQQAFVGATPERLVEASRTMFATAGIAGSISRGKNQTEDQENSLKLLKDAKNSYEHQVVVERIKKQLKDFTQGELLVSDKSLLKNRDIQHLFVTVKGSRKGQTSLLDVVRELHPTPALGGEPKAEALRWLAEKEVAGRGLYGAPIGWLDLTEDVGEFAVGIRSGIFSGNQGLLYAGCGIVDDSDPEAERLETGLKFQPMIRGVKGNDE